MFNSWRSKWRENLPAVFLAIWWFVFASISFYWAAGGLWLVDTAVQEQGVELALERPAWIVAVLTLTAFFKLAFVLFAYLVVAPVGRKIPRFLYLLAGWGIGLACIGYGVQGSTYVIPLLDSGVMTLDQWMRLLVWMPQFWVGGLLAVTTTVRFQNQTKLRFKQPPGA